MKSPNLNNIKPNQLVSGMSKITVTRLPGKPEQPRSYRGPAQLIGFAAFGPLGVLAARVLIKDDSP